MPACRHALYRLAFYIPKLKPSVYCKPVVETSGMAATQSVTEKGALKVFAAERTTQSIQATATLFQRFQNSPSSERVAKLPKDLASKIPSIKNTGAMLEQMPAVITALDAHLDNCLHSGKYLHYVRSVLLGEDFGEEKIPGADAEPLQDVSVVMNESAPS